MSGLDQMRIRIGRGVPPTPLASYASYASLSHFKCARSQDLNAIFQKIEVGEDFSEEGIRETVDRNVESILRLDMSRFAYARATLHFDMVRELPMLHTMDHRVRLPRLEIEHGATDGDVLGLIRDRLNQMLCISDHPGGRELVAQALKLDPGRDAVALVSILKTSRRVFDLMIRGRIGSAIASAKELDFAGLGADSFRKVAANLLCYHCAHQVQLIAVRGHVLDHFAYKISATAREFTAGGACKNVFEILDLIEAATRRVVNETKQPSQDEVIKDLEQRAENIRANISQSDDQLLSGLGVFLQDNRRFLNQMKNDVSPLRTELTGSLHKAIFGFTAFHALIFAVSRLVYLRSRASQVIDFLFRGRCPTFEFSRADLPARTSQCVCKILFCYRSTILRDHNFVKKVPNEGLGDLSVEWENRSYGSNNQQEAIKTARKTIREAIRPAFFFPVADRLDTHQHVDIIPEFFLQERVEGVRPWGKLLANARKAHAQNQSHQPPNVRRASGKR